MSDDITVTLGQLANLEGQILPLVGCQKELPRVRSELRCGSAKQEWRNLLADFVSSSIDGLELLSHNLATKKIQRLNLSSSLPYRGNAHIAQNLLLLVRLDVTVATINLNPHACSFKTSFGEKSLGWQN